MTKEEYGEYLESEIWRVRRLWALDHARQRCQVCAAQKELDVHHNTYDNIGNEKQRDLVVLCRDCHKRFHDRMPNIEKPDTWLSGQKHNLPVHGFGGNWR